MATHVGLRLTLCGVLAVSACATQSNVQGPVLQFSQATLASASVQDAFLDSVDQAGSTGKSAVIREKWFQNHKSLTIDTMGQLPPTVSPAARAAIDKVLDSIRLYGQALQALANDGTTATLDQNAKNLASGLLTFNSATLQPLTGGNGLLPPSAVDGVVAGVTAIANMVISGMIARDVQQAAGARQADIAAIVSALKQINTSYAGIASAELNGLRIANWEVLRSPGGSIQDFDLLMSEVSAAPAQSDPGKVNAALDALTKANAAIAAAGPGSATAQIQAFVQAATDAYNYYKTLPTK